MLLFDLMATVVLTGAAGAPLGASCPSLLDLSAAARRTTGEILAAGEGDSRAVSFVAMTPGDLASLLERGVSNGAREFRVHPNLDHPTVARWRADRRELVVGDGDRARREAALESDAWVNAAVEIVRARAGMMGPVPLAHRKIFDRLFADLRPMHHALRNESFSPEFARLWWVAGENREIPYAEPLGCDLEASGYLEELVNAGPDYGRLVARQRLRAWAELLRVRWDDVDRPDSRARRALVDLHAELPGRAGFRVALDAKSFNRIRWSRDAEPTILTLDLCFVAGVTAYGEADRRELTRILDRRGEL